jgi:hypothetical protein
MQRRVGSLLKDLLENASGGLDEDGLLRRVLVEDDVGD